MTDIEQFSLGLEDGDLDALELDLVEPEPSDPARTIEVSSSLAGVGIVVSKEALHVAITKPAADGLELVCVRKLTLERGRRWPLAELAGLLRQHGARGVRPVIALPPSEYSEEVIRLPALKPREFRRWTAERRRADATRTVGHFTLHRSDESIEILEISAPAKELVRAIEMSRRAGLRQAKVVPPNLAGIGRLSKDIFDDEGAVLVADLLSEQQAALHLWNNGELVVYRPVRVPPTVGSPWRNLAREVLRTVTYFRERTRGEQVREVAFVHTGSARPSREGVEALLDTDVFRGEMRCVERPDGSDDGDPRTGIAINLACMRSPREMIDLVPDEIRLRPLRRVLVAALLALTAAALLGAQQLREHAANVGRSARLEIARLSPTLDTRRAEAAELREQLRQIDQFDAELAILGEAHNRKFPALFSLRVVAERIPRELELERIRFAMQDGSPEVTLDASRVVRHVRREGRSGLEPETSTAALIDSLKATLVSAQGVTNVRLEATDIRLPTLGDDGKWTSRDRFRIQFTVDREELP